MERVNRWRVSTPDSEPRLFQSEAEAEQTRNDWITDHELPDALEVWEKDRAEFYDKCEVKTVRAGSGFSARSEKRVSLPDGIQRPVGGRDPAEIVEEAWLAKNPKPTSFSLFGKSSATMGRVVVWEGDLFLDGEQRKLPLVEQWVYGLPIDVVLKTLNELAAKGWSVVHASEDRGLFAGPTVSSDAFVTRVRYLLTR
jgi:hypothetical protein